MRLSDLPQQCTSEPALDPVCAAYTQAACPMVAGRLTHYRTTPMRLGPGMAPAADQGNQGPCSALALAIRSKSTQTLSYE